MNQQHRGQPKTENTQEPESAPAQEDEDTPQIQKKQTSQTANQQRIHEQHNQQGPDAPLPAPPPAPAPADATDVGVKLAAQLLGTSTAIVVAAGAGMSLDSGLPDYRSPAEWTAAFPELAARQLRYEDMAKAAHFDDSPRVVWAWYKHRYDTYQAAQPHAGYAVLKRWCDGARDGYRVFTSNVDGFFQRAGFPRSSVVECHGSMARLQCTSGKHGIWKSDAAFRKLSVDPQDPCTLAAGVEVPRCRTFGCQRHARPNILLFKDTAWEGTAATAHRGRYGAWLDALPDDSTLAILEVGAGNLVPTVRLEVERVVASRLARQQRTHVIRINPGRDVQDPSVQWPGQHVVIRGKAFDILTSIDAAMAMETA
ncbi:Sir2 family transcriptional regulator [Salpingoeca rosetta]|uniref:Sir2 family transcriptional regulator n=1 Tax=Salpingoeca rosetta (strain ATCC 50818 / BSB-021) TaxID=946362 RepID=F2UAD1_SALR5|nr:Sir2 family transcriptional regulator [Salpingoeca rosetta]EGD73706.1 Sir2 family transcriptional regulator [Salpingoeca rosetta]|eukprot:XP_004993987.1 Sir2 family transcriptional regulator [Salpingoeca rosetta]